MASDKSYSPNAETARRQSIPVDHPAEVTEGKWLASTATYIQERMNAHSPTVNEFVYWVPKVPPDRLTESTLRRRSLKVVSKDEKASITGLKGKTSDDGLGEYSATLLIEADADRCSVECIGVLGEVSGLVKPDDMQSLGCTERQSASLTVNEIEKSATCTHMPFTSITLMPHAFSPAFPSQNHHVSQPSPELDRFLVKSPCEGDCKQQPIKVASSSNVPGVGMYLPKAKATWSTIRHMLRARTGFVPVFGYDTLLAGLHRLTNGSQSFELNTLTIDAQLLVTPMEISQMEHEMCVYSLSCAEELVRVIEAHLLPVLCCPRIARKLVKRYRQVAQKVATSILQLRKVSPLSKAWRPPQPKRRNGGSLPDYPCPPPFLCLSHLFLLCPFNSPRMAKHHSVCRHSMRPPALLRSFESAKLPQNMPSNQPSHELVILFVKSSDEGYKLRPRKVISLLNTSRVEWHSPEAKASALRSVMKPGVTQVSLVHLLSCEGWW